MRWCTDCYPQTMVILHRDRETGLDFTHQLINQANYLENVRAERMCCDGCIPLTAALASLDAINKGLFVLDENNGNS